MLVLHHQLMKAKLKPERKDVAVSMTLSLILVTNLILLFLQIERLSDSDSASLHSDQAGNESNSTSTSESDQTRNESCTYHKVGGIYYRYNNRIYKNVYDIIMVYYKCNVLLIDAIATTVGDGLVN